MTLYFAYGSNLNLDGMRSRCPGAKPAGVARLHDHKLVFRGVADVEHAPGEVVWGGLWECDENHMRSLDRYEGYPTFYGREWVDVETATGTKRAVVYKMVNDDSMALPSEYYLDIIAQGFVSFHLPLESLYGALRAAKERVLGEGHRQFVRDGRKRLRPVEVEVPIVEREVERAFGKIRIVNGEIFVAPDKTVMAKPPKRSKRPKSMRPAHRRKRHMDDPLTDADFDDLEDLFESDAPDRDLELDLLLANGGDLDEWLDRQADLDEKLDRKRRGEVEC